MLGYAGGCNIYWGSVDQLGCTKFQAIETASETEICNGLKAGRSLQMLMAEGTMYF